MKESGNGSPRGCQGRTVELRSTWTAGAAVPTCYLVLFLHSVPFAERYTFDAELILLLPASS